MQQSRGQKRIVEILWNKLVHLQNLTVVLFLFTISVGWQYHSTLCEVKAWNIFSILADTFVLGISAYLYLWDGSESTFARDVYIIGA